LINSVLCVAGLNVRAAGSTTNGWFQDEKALWQSIINGNGGVNIGALGGTLTLSATTINAANGTTINVRSKSSSEIGRWTIEVKNETSLRPLVNKDKVEMKFK
jgi:hypothetical protein